MEDDGVVVQSDENGMEIEPQSPVAVSKTEEELGNTVRNSSAKKRQRKEPVTPTVERPFRERKLVERFVVSTEKEVKEFKIEKGTGTTLKDIPNVVYKLSKRKATDEIVQLLHRILYGRQGKTHTAKTHIQQFSGFVWGANEEKEKQKVKEKLEKCVKESLIQLSELLDLNINKSSKKEDAVTKLFEFLESPYKTSDKLLEEKEKAAKLKKAKKKLKKAKKAKTMGHTPQKKKKVVKEKAGDDDNDDNDVDEDDEDEEDGHSSGREVESEDGSDYEEYSMKSSGSKKRGRQTPKKSRKQETDEEENEDDEDEEHEEAEDKDEEDTDEKMAEPEIEDQNTESNSTLQETTAEKDNEFKEKAGDMAVVDEEKSDNDKSSEPETTVKAKVDSSKKGKKTPKKQDTVKSGDDTEADVEEKAEKETKKSGKSVAKDVATPKAKPAKKQESASVKKSAQKPVKDVKPKKQKSEDPKLPSDEELRAAIAKILEDADFSKVTFTDVLRQLGENFKVDFTSNKAHVKALIQEEIAKLVNEGDDSEEEDKEEDETEKAEGKDPVTDSNNNKNNNEVSKPEDGKDNVDAAEREDSN